MTGILWSILCSFGKIGLIALGGGNSMIKLIEYEAITVRHWLVPEEFSRMVGTTFLFPGLTGVKLAALIGYKQAGVLGILTAILALNIPGLFLALIGYRVLSSGNNPITQKIMITVQYGALALLAAASVSVAQGVLELNYSWPLIIATLIFFTALVCFNLSPFLGFIVFIMITFFFVRLT